jgi:hypothetical protein
MADVTSPFGFPYPEDTDLVRDGASDIENLAEGVNDYLTGGYLYAGTRYYTSSGTFAKADPLGTGDIGLRAVRVRVVAGGGGGGGAPVTGSAQSSMGASGSSGSYSESFILASSLSSSETVTIGAGGTGGGSGASASSGGDGGASSFGSLVTTNGGGGGQVGVVTSAFPAAVPNRDGGAAGSAGDIRYSGAPSTTGVIVSFSSAAPTISGSSFFSGGRASGTNANGFAGSFGSGGSGTFTTQGIAGRSGGAGGAGLIIVDCFV